MIAAASSPMFHAYGTSHWSVLGLTLCGSVAVVLAGRDAPESVTRVGCRVLAVVIVALNLGDEVWRFRPADVIHTLPLQLSDLAPYVAGVALWTWWRRPCCLTEYWCLTFSSQALFTPVLRGPDFPSPMFLVFFANHILVVWAAVALAWGLRLRPGWRDFWFAVALTGVWACLTFGFNAIASTDYAFLNAKPSTPSVLDLLGPWPWYLIPEATLVVAFWALLTWLWQRHDQRTLWGNDQVGGLP